MHKATELIIMAIVMSLLEAYCLYGAKKFGADTHAFWYLSAVLGYAVIVLILARLSRTGKLGVINSVWNGISICTSLVLGLAVFSETPSRMEMLGVVTIVAGVVLTQL